MNKYKGLPSKMSHKEEKHIYLKGVENRYAVENGRVTKKGNIQRIIYYIIVSLMAPKRNSVNDKILFVNGKSQRKFNFDYPEAQKVFRGFGEEILHSIRNDFYLVTPFSRARRFNLFFKALRTYKKTEEGDFLSLWLDFISVHEFLKKVKPKVLISRGHIDEFTTWFGEFARIYNYRFDVYQHGVMGCSNTAIIPHKLYYSSFYAFDNYSIGFFKENFIGNADCKYQVYDFLPSVKFEKIQKKQGRIYVGIGEQKNEDWVFEVVRQLQKCQPTPYIIIMKHPLSSGNYSMFQDVQVETSKKYSNIDFFITQNSTLAIDYYRANKEVNVIYTDESAKGCFSDYNFIFVEKLDQLPCLIK